MGKNFSKFLLKCGRWKYNDFPDVKKAILLVAPHTSMVDFYYGSVYFSTQGHFAQALIKKEAFFWPLGPILKKLGAVPVDRGRRSGLTEKAITSFNEAEDEFFLVLTPEGTRSPTKNWKKGFIRIAKATNVPVILGVIDKGNRKMGVLDQPFLDMSGTDAEIMERLKRSYVGLEGLRKGKFKTGYE